jgi:hypothetical protein
VGIAAAFLAAALVAGFDLVAALPMVLLEPTTEARFLGRGALVGGGAAVTEAKPSMGASFLVTIILGLSERGACFFFGPGNVPGLTPFGGAGRSAILGRLLGHNQHRSIVAGRTPAGR